VRHCRHRAQETEVILILRVVWMQRELLLAVESSRERAGRPKGSALTLTRHWDRRRYGIELYNGPPSTHTAPGRRSCGTHTLTTPEHKPPFPSLAVNAT
jgi:hypothetical protein